jgi:SNF2 family DNA or RNA helicase
MTLDFRTLDPPPKGLYLADDDRLGSFYIPVLGQAVLYDRLVGYWRSSSLSVAASGLVEFIRHGGIMRVVAGAELTDEDVAACERGHPFDQVLTDRLLAGLPAEAVDTVTRHYLDLLAWLVREGRLEIRIGVARSPEGRLLRPSEAGRLFHSKYGALHDESGNTIVFAGSDNESAQGWRDNHETLSVYRSWHLPEAVWAEYAAPVIRDFEMHWQGGTGCWAVVDLPEAVQQDLIRRVPEDYEPPQREPGRDVAPGVDRETAAAELRDLLAAPTKAGGTGVGLVTAPVGPWPHQTAIASRIVATYPRSYLLADEVGLGKTIEAGLAVRELLLSQKARTMLLLVPASVLRQWQEELWEKLALEVPCYDGSRFWTYEPDGLPDHQRELEPAPGNPWNGFPVLLASSHLARRRARQRDILDAEGWDVVLVDEAHHAGRGGSKATDTPNRLLELLLAMKERGKWGALLLATATPMQMHTHEVWDLLELLGLHGGWAESAAIFEGYYQQLAEPPEARDWAFLKVMCRDHLAQAHIDRRLEERMGRELSPVKVSRIRSFHQHGLKEAEVAGMGPMQRRCLDEWLHTHTPMRDRVFRTTRDTLRAYKVIGLLKPTDVIPERRVNDEFVTLTPQEASLYERIEDYISRYYDAYTADQATKPLGFIMTVYRRRLTSSFAAIERSLKRRLDVLTGNALAQDLLDNDDLVTLETSGYFDPDLLGQQAQAIAGEIAELRQFLAALGSRPPDETKMRRLHEEVEQAFRAGHRTVVIFTQYTDTMDYLRDQLALSYGSQVACYSGRGGETRDPVTRQWTVVDKADVKTLFREGQAVRILIGTDAMSEGLNLQTCGKVINYDMPWNFMRVEQRIGRLDRIGGKPVVEVTNYFYENTVEEQVYKGIAEDFDWFEHVVGPAQPVLGRLESAMETMAMQKREPERNQRIREMVVQIRADMKAAEKRPVQLSEMTADPRTEEDYAAAPAVTMERFAQMLLTNPLTRKRFHPHPMIDSTYLLEVGANRHPVTFDRQVYDDNAEVGFLTYAHPLFDQLMDEVLAKRRPSRP